MVNVEGLAPPMRPKPGRLKVCADRYSGHTSMIRMCCGGKPRRFELSIDAHHRALHCGNSEPTGGASAPARGRTRNARKSCHLQTLSFSLLMVHLRGSAPRTSRLSAERSTAELKVVDELLAARRGSCWLPNVSPGWLAPAPPNGASGRFCPCDLLDVTEALCC